MSKDPVEQKLSALGEVLDKSREPSALLANKFLQDEIAKLREQLAELTAGEASYREQLLAVESKLIAITATAENYRRDAKAAEAKLKALDGQEPTVLAECNTDSLAGWINELRLLSEHRLIDQGWLRGAIRTIWLGIAKYAEPVPPVDVQELQEAFRTSKRPHLSALSMVTKERVRIAELGRKLAEQQAVIQEQIACIEPIAPNLADTMRKLADKCGSGKLNSLLAQAREEGRRDAVPEGWKTIRYPITEEMHIAAAKVILRAHGLDDTPQHILEAMLAAAPKPEVAP